MCSICNNFTNVLHRHFSAIRYISKHLHKPCFYQLVQLFKLLFAKIHELFNFVQSLSNFVLL